jgi:hypothetical protein
MYVPAQPIELCNGYRTAAARASASAAASCGLLSSASAPFPVSITQYSLPAAPLERGFCPAYAKVCMFAIPKFLLRDMESNILLHGSPPFCLIA